MNEIEMAVQQRLDNLIKPRGSLGKTEGMVRRYAVLKGTADPEELLQGSGLEELQKYFRQHGQEYRQVFCDKQVILLKGISAEQKFDYNLTLLQAGLRCYKEMRTFAEAGIEV